MPDLAPPLSESAGTSGKARTNRLLPEPGRLTRDTVLWSDARREEVAEQHRAEFRSVRPVRVRPEPTSRAADTTVGRVSVRAPRGPTSPKHRLRPYAAAYTPDGETYTSDGETYTPAGETARQSGTRPQGTYETAMQAVRLMCPVPHRSWL